MARVLQTKMVGYAPDRRSMNRPPEVVCTCHEPEPIRVPWQVKLIVLASCVGMLAIFGAALARWSMNPADHTWKIAAFLLLVAVHWIFWWRKGE